MGNIGSTSDTSEKVAVILARARPWRRRHSLGRLVASIRLNEARTNAALGVVALAAVASGLAVAPGARGILGGVLALVMLAIALTDARYFIIPNELSAAAFALGIVHAAAQGAEAALPVVAMAAARAAASATIFWAVRVTYRRLRGREGMGLGDVKLAAVAGAWLDWPVIPIAVEIAALAALAVFALRPMATGEPVRATVRMPFGVFLAPAIWLGWFIEATVLPPF
jgi:leader peptidase (prepilin peptidase)/N-methyltransferase